VIVAVIDTGVAYEDYTQTVKRKTIRYYRAPDLVQTNFVAGYDFVNDDTHPNDDNGHGTHVTGTVAQSTNNSIGVAGVAFNCKIMPLKVLDKSGSGTYADVADAIMWAADNGVKVINLSRWV
jgi:serine protease